MVAGRGHPALRRLAEVTKTYPLLARLRRGFGAFADEAKKVPEPAPVQTIALDYKVDPQPRWGYGKPSHPELLRILDAGRARYSDLLGGFLPFRESFARIPLPPDPADPRAPNWNNGMLPALDTIALYGLLVMEAPSTYVEIGSGNSTKFARRAIDDNRLATKIVSVDPHPRAECDLICDEIIREPFERIDLGLFDRVGSGDVVFLDGSHRCFTNSDATVFFMDVMPFLPPGALIHIHDIWLPDDYPPAWSDRFYSEQYLLAAWLLAQSSTYEVVLPNFFISEDPELHGILDPIWSDPRMSGVETHGCSFWMRRR